jgi:hypothetical protein
LATDGSATQLLLLLPLRRTLVLLLLVGLVAVLLLP